MSRPGVFEAQKQPEAAKLEGLQQWSFNYKVGPAPKTGVVLGRDEDEGYRVACEWCSQNEVRPPAKVFPVILADPSILKKYRDGDIIETDELERLTRPAHNGVVSR